MKIGLDDFLLKCGAEEFRKLQKAARPPVVEGSDWRPWKNAKRTLNPGILADALAETSGSLERWQKWEAQGCPVGFAKAELTTITGGASIIYSAGVWWIYRNSQPGVWVEVEQEVILGWITNIIGVESVRGTTSKGVKEILQSLAYRELKTFNQNNARLNLKNGVLNLNTYKMEPHSKEDFSTIQLNVIYDDTAECPRFLQFLNEVLIAEDGTPDREAQCLVQEFVGYCLTADTRFEKALMLIGEGSNGKSVLLTVIEELIGEGNISAVPLEQMNNEFRLAELHGKLLNLCAEVSSRGRNPVNADVFKQVISGDLIQASKKYQPPFNFHPTAKHIFAMNDLPTIYDTSHGFWRRLFVVRFRRTFSEKEQDRGLIDKLRAELPGILLWALSGLCALREQGQFTTARTVEAETANFRRQSNPVSTFVEECCEVGNPEWWTPSATLFTKYKTWADVNELKKTNSVWFGRHLSRHDYRIKQAPTRDEKGWSGIKLAGGVNV